MNDVKGAADMSQGNATSYTSDRFGNANSALALNGGWTQVPSGVYFNSQESTISVWVLPQQFGSWARIVDFGNGPSSNNIVLTLSFGNSLTPVLACIGSFSATSARNLTLNEWQFLAATFNGTNARIYLNGTLVADINFQIITPSTQSSNSCYIGKSNWPDNGYSSSYLDDLRFYNKSLTQDEIIELMNSQFYTTTSSTTALTSSSLCSKTSISKCSYIRLLLFKFLFTFA
jgi:hypothetical protein